MQRTSRVPTLLLMVTLSAGFAACASGGGDGGDRPRPNPDVITAEELAESTFATILDAVASLRPRWLQSRGGWDAQQAILDGARLGGTDQLRSINILDVVSIEHLSASDATTRYGRGFTSGAILVRTR